MIRDFYRKIYDRHSAFYRAHPRMKKLLVGANYALTAAVFFAYALLCLLELVIHKGKAADFLKLVGIPLLCLFAVSALRNLFNRKRPYEEGAVPVIAKKKKGRSFPSRHLASAFVIGIVFLPYCAWAGASVLAAGVLLGYVRFAAGVHYPSDLIAGAAIGALFGLLAFI